MNRVRVALAHGAPLVHATFVARVNQFLIEARLNGQLVRAHMADRGRLVELLRPDVRLLMAPRDEIGRKTAFQVAAVYHGDDLVSLDTQLPNRLVSAALASGALPQFARYTRVQPEVSVGPYRFDFRLSEGLATCVLEVKSVGLVQNGVAIFPDAPTERGLRHVEALTNFSRNGQRSALVFIVQRGRGRALVPNDEIDEAFARAFRRAIASGVEIYAYSCPLTPEGIQLGEPLPVFGSIEGLPEQYRSGKSR